MMQPAISKIIVATSNKGKWREFEALFAPLHIQVLSNQDVDSERIPDIVEDGATFEENALKKARAYYDQFGIPALADDSGLEIEALNGEPGIFSARYAGEHCSDEDNIEKVLEQMKGIPSVQRKARFTCAIAFISGNEPPLVARGHCPGYIAEERSGTEGFGYDPIFYLPDHGKTMAQLTKEEKNSISHRYQAMKQLLQLMNK